MEHSTSVVGEERSLSLYQLFSRRYDFLLALIGHFNLKHSSFGTCYSTAESENGSVHAFCSSIHCYHHISAFFAGLLNFIHFILQVTYGLLKKLKFIVKVSLLFLDLFLLIDFFDKITILGLKIRKVAENYKV